MTAQTAQVFDFFIQSMWLLSDVDTTTISLEFQPVTDETSYTNGYVNY